jgi:hypothetical protein
MNTDLSIDQGGRLIAEQKLYSCSQLRAVCHPLYPKNYTGPLCSRQQSPEMCLRYPYYNSKEIYQYNYSLNIQIGRTGGLSENLLMPGRYKAGTPVAVRRCRCPNFLVSK